MKFYLLTDAKEKFASEFSLFAISENIFFKVELFPKGFFFSLMGTKGKQPEGSEEITRDEFFKVIDDIEIKFDVNFNLSKNVLLF